MASSRILGNVIIKIDGSMFKTVPGSTDLDFGGETRETVMADNTFNYRGTPKASMLTTKFAHVATTDIKKLNDLEGALIEIVTDIGDGITYTMENATRTGDPIKTSSSDGQITFQAEGEPISGL